MATYNQGVLGGFSGKIGPVIVSNWRGKNIMRSVPTKPIKAPSPAQQLQRDKFAFVLQFLNPIKAQLAETFGVNMGGKTPFNNALSYHLKEAVTVTPMGFEMQYAKVLIGKGPLSGMEHPEEVVVSPSTLLLQWVNNSAQALAYAEDSLLVIAYVPSLDRYEFFLETALREDTQAVLEFPQEVEGHEVMLWATFTNSELEMTATSVFLGGFWG